MQKITINNGCPNKNKNNRRSKLTRASVHAFFFNNKAIFFSNLRTYVQPPNQMQELWRKDVSVVKNKMIFFFSWPGVRAANMTWKIIKVEAGTVCSGNAGFMPTPLNKKWAMILVWIFNVLLQMGLPESPINLPPVSENVSEYPIRYHYKWVIKSISIEYVHLQTIPEMIPQQQKVLLNTWVTMRFLL